MGVTTKPDNGSKKLATEEKDKISMRQYSVLIAGAICSAFVGTLYSYSHVADEVDTDLKTAGNPSHQNIADTAYYVGFFGQYAAFIPGAIFDAFGPAATILYGAIVVGLGYNTMAWGVMAGKGCLAYLLWAGIFMAGQGSKGLGFGTMLGTMNTFPASWTATIGGVYLCFDAFSALIAMGVYKLFYESSNPTFKCPYGEKYNNSNYFFLLGIFIGCVGVCTFVAYLIWYRAPGTEEDLDETKKIENSPINTSDSEVENPSPVGTVENPSSQLETSGSNVQMEGVSNAAPPSDEVTETDALLDDEKETEKEKPIISKKTNWIAVLGAYLIMFFAESQGLAYNKVIGKAFMSARKGRVGVLKLADIPDNERFVFHGDATYMIDEIALKLQFEHAMNVALNAKDQERDEVLPVNLHCQISGDDYNVSWRNKDGKQIDIISKEVKVGKNDVTKTLLSVPKKGGGDILVTAQDLKNKNWMVSYGENEGEYDFAVQEKKHFPIADKIVEIEKSQFIISLQANPVTGEIMLYGMTGDTLKVQVEKMQTSATINAFDSTLDTWFNVNKDKALTTPAIKIEPEQPILYDADRLLKKTDKASGAADDAGSKTHKDEMKNDKFYIGVSFIVGNGVGRLAFGFLSDFTAKRVSFMQKSFYIMALNITFVLAFLIMFISGINESGPSYVIVMTLIMGLTYGGIFTLVTAYFKQICEPKRVGVILGCALIIMAIGAFFFGNLFQKMTLETMVSVEGADAVGPNYANGFFLLGFILNLLMVPVSGFLFYQNLLEIKGKEGSEVVEQDLMEITDESDIGDADQQESQQVSAVVATQPSRTTSNLSSGSKASLGSAAKSGSKASLGSAAKSGSTTQM